LERMILALGVVNISRSAQCISSQFRRGFMRLEVVGDFLEGFEDAGRDRQSKSDRFILGAAGLGGLRQQFDCDFFLGFG